MKKVIVGSSNPMKWEAVKESFTRVFREEEFEFTTHKAESRVADQPFGSTETKHGAYNRSRACKESYPDADFFVGLEGGIEESNGEYWVSAWMCVQGKENKIGYGRTGSFLLPMQVSKLIKEGKELAVATDQVFDEINSGQKGGAVGILTNGEIGRKDFYREAIIFALIPFINQNLYS